MAELLSLSLRLSVSDSVTLSTASLTLSLCLFVSLYLFSLVSLYFFLSLSASLSLSISFCLSLSLCLSLGRGKVGKGAKVIQTFIQNTDPQMKRFQEERSHLKISKNIAIKSLFFLLYSDFFKFKFLCESFYCIITFIPHLLIFS